MVPDRKMDHSRIEKDLISHDTDPVCGKLANRKPIITDPGSEIINTLRLEYTLQQNSSKNESHRTRNKPQAFL
jgi:hypothetical protein